MAATRKFRKVGRSGPPLYDNATYPANFCSFSGRIEFADFGENFGKTVGETIQAAARGAVRQGAAVHFGYVLSGQYGVDQTIQASAGGGESSRM